MHLYQKARKLQAAGDTNLDALPPQPLSLGPDVSVPI